MRNAAYDRAARRVAWAEAPVISVGNLTTGGTGKTPAVAYLAGRLGRMHCRCGILMRGYRRGDDPEGGDEARLLRVLCPDAAVVVDPDRVRGARTAVDRHDVDVLILDDGFQHRRMGRDLDICLVDATCPFGYGHLFPRGLLREHPRGLRRADVVILTRTDQATPESVADLEATCRRLAPAADVLWATHEPVGLTSLDGDVLGLDELRGAPAVAVCGLGRPEAFTRTLQRLAVDVRLRMDYPDHHRYGPEDAGAIRRLADDADTELIVTTAKDAVKLQQVPGGLGRLTIWVVHVQMRITRGVAAFADKLASVSIVFGERSGRMSWGARHSGTQ
jgi:tetraacyldisaccharide 4'-kinase